MAWRLRETVVPGSAGFGRRAFAYIALLTLAVGGTVWTTQRLATHLAIEAGGAQPRTLTRQPSPAQSLRPALFPQSRVTLTQDQWHDRLLSPEFWRERRAPRSTFPPSTPPSPAVWRLFDPLGPWLDRGVEPLGWATYRTLCVRLCDGYFWPISFATTPDNFARDQAQCASSCKAPTRLYIYRNPGEEPTDMRTVDGEPLSRLPTANLYRTKFEPSCRCGPEPWEKEALERHRIYALEEAQRKGNRDAREELARLKSERATEQRRMAARRAATVAAIRAGALAARQDLPQIVALSATPAPASSAAPTRVLSRLDVGPRGAAARPSDPAVMRLGAAPAANAQSERRASTPTKSRRKSR